MQRTIAARQGQRAASSDMNGVVAPRIGTMGANAGRLSDR